MDINLRLIFVIFSQLNYAIFTVNVNGFKVFSVGNFSYSFMSDPLKLFRCFDHVLKMLHCLDVIPLLFCHFFTS